MRQRGIWTRRMRPMSIVLGYLILTIIYIAIAMLPVLFASLPTVGR